MMLRQPVQYGIQAYVPGGAWMDGICSDENKVWQGVGCVGGLVEDGA